MQAPHFFENSRSGKEGNQFAEDCLQDNCERRPFNGENELFYLEAPAPCEVMHSAATVRGIA